MNAKEYTNSKEKSSVLNFIYVCLTDLTEKIKNKLKSDDTAVIVIDTFNKNGIAEQRKLFVDLMNEKLTALLLFEENTKTYLMKIYNYTHHRI